MSVLLSDPRMPPDAPDTLIEAESPRSLLARRRRGDWLLFAAIFITMVLAVPPLMWLGTTNGFGLVIGVAVSLAAALAVVRKPEIGLFLVLACVVLVEENPLTIPDGTDRLNIFYWPERIAGLPERPIGFLFLFILFMFASQRFVRWQRALRGGELLAPLLLFLAAVLIGVVHGITSGGDFKIIVLEIRPFWYLFVGYLLAYNTVTRREHVSAFIWIVILGAGVKALQGTYITFVVLHGDLAGYNEIMSHEESFFWVALLLLIFLFALHHRQRGQLIAALALVPFTGISLVANNRRADYVALLVAILVAWVLLIAIRPGRRAGLVTGLVICPAVGDGLRRGLLAFGRRLRAAGARRHLHHPPRHLGRARLQLQPVPPDRERRPQIHHQAKPHHRLRLRQALPAAGAAAQYPGPRPVLLVRAAQHHLLGLDAPRLRRLPGALVHLRQHHCARLPDRAPPA